MFTTLVLDNQLCCTANITVMAQSCRFAFYNICRIRPLLMREAAQLLVKVLVISCLDYFNSSLDSLPPLLNLCSVSGTLQRVSCPTCLNSPM
jgi:hypothetical protein